MTQKKSHDAIGMATYSNSKSTVLSYASIFESLWETELYQQIKEANNRLNVLNNSQKDHEKSLSNIAAHELRTTSL
jgi:hypothetical protein